MEHGCPLCLDMVNGVQVSKCQRRICEMVGGELNAPAGRRRIDIAKIVGDVKIAIKYDSWFFHGGKQAEDLAKDQEFLAKGWRILRIRSNKLVPTKAQLDHAIQQLLVGDKWLDIELADWGKGRIAPFCR